MVRARLCVARANGAGVERVALAPGLMAAPGAARRLRCAGWMLATALRKNIPLGVTLTLATCKALLGHTSRTVAGPSHMQACRQTLPTCAS